MHRFDRLWRSSAFAKLSFISLRATGLVMVSSEMFHLLSRRLLQFQIQVVQPCQPQVIAQIISTLMLHQFKFNQ